MDAIPPSTHTQQFAQEALIDGLSPGKGAANEVTRITRTLVPCRSMKKKHERNFRTHFDQVPLEDVKRIAAADISKDEKAGTDDVIVKPVSRKSVPKRMPAHSRDRKRK